MRRCMRPRGAWFRPCDRVHDIVFRPVHAARRPRAGSGGGFAVRDMLIGRQARHVVLPERRAAEPEAMRRGRMRAGMDGSIIDSDILPASVLARILDGIMVRRDGGHRHRFRYVMAGRDACGFYRVKSYVPATPFGSPFGLRGWIPELHRSRDGSSTLMRETDSASFQDLSQSAASDRQRPSSS